MSTQQDSEQQGLSLNVGRNLEVEGDITGEIKLEETSSLPAATLRP